MNLRLNATNRNETAINYVSEIMVRTVSSNTPLVNKGSERGASPSAELKPLAPDLHTDKFEAPRFRHTTETEDTSWGTRAAVLMTMMAPAVGAAMVGATVTTPVEAAAMPTDFAEGLLFDAANAEDVQLASTSMEERDEREQELADKLGAFVKNRFGGDYDKAFEYFDKDNDAKLSRSELSDALGDIGIGNFITRGMWVDGIMEKLDKSPTDGKLSYDELLSTVGQTT